MSVQQSVRFFFSSLEDAAQALLTVLEDAETTKAEYVIGGLSAKTVLSSGLLLQGDIEQVSSAVEKAVPAAALQQY